MQIWDSRFIPTCVGNTAMTGLGSRFTTVHPHVRGEHIAPSGGSLRKNGSSPRAWGTLLFLLGCHDCLRFIPTCVGNTRLAGGRMVGIAVHPHVRGEHGDCLNQEW